MLRSSELSEASNSRNYFKKGGKNERIRKRKENFKPSGWNS